MTLVDAIVVKGLVHSYGSKMMLKGLDFVVKKGEIFGLLGENGSGKTTTIAILTSQLRPLSGQVSTLGLDPRRGGHSLKTKIGLASHELRLTGNRPLDETLKFYGSLYGIPRDKLKRRVNELLEMVNLKAHASQLVKNFSEGMKRRVNVSLALIHDPELVFLDEPTSGLDPSARRDMWQAIRRLKHQGKTFFLTTHHMEEAEYLCDRVAILDEGRIMAVGTPAELKSAFAGGKIVDIEMDCDPSIVEQFEPIVGKGNVVCEGGLNMIVKEPEKVLQNIMLQLMAGGVGRIQVREPSLEDVFLRLTGKKLLDGNPVPQEIRHSDRNALIRKVFFWRGLLHRVRAQ